MELELKNIKHSARASEETHCYRASLYANGKPVAVVSNDGQGGADRVRPHGKFSPQLHNYTDAGGDYRSVMSKVDAYFASLPKTPYEQCLEFWCEDQINDWLSARKLKNHLKKSYVYHLADGAGVYAHESRPASTVAVVLNDLPFADALSIWKGTA
jgi:hypothetical protein